MMRIQVICSLTLLFGSALFAEGISLSGIIRNQSGQPLQSVTVTLKGQGIVAQTGSNGTYSIIGNAGIVFGRNSRKQAAVSKQDVGQSVYNVRGQRVSAFARRGIGKDSYEFALLNRKLASQVYIAAVVANVGARRHAFVTKTQNFTSGALRTSGKASKAYAVAIDTLEASAGGYITRQMPIYEYVSVNLDLVLFSSGSEPFISCKDVFLAYDTLDNGVAQIRVRPIRGDTLCLNVRLRNLGGSNALSVRCSLSTQNSYVSIPVAVAGYNNIGSQTDTLNLTPYKLIVDPSVPAAERVMLQMHIKDSWGGTWLDSMEYLINPFAVQAQTIDDDNVPDSYGNDNGALDAGEAVEYTPRLQNKSGQAVTNVSAVLLSTTSSIAVRNGDKVWSYGDFATEQMKLPEWDYVFDIGQYFPWGNTQRFDVLIYGQVDGVRRRWVLPLTLPRSAILINFGKLIPAMDSSFQMGATGGIGATPVHGVAFTYNFYMDSTEVTQAEYSALMTSSYADFAAPAWNSTYGVGDGYPAYYVSWYNAVLYCNARSKRDGKDSAYSYQSRTGQTGGNCTLNGLNMSISKNGYRLPTEAEWEYACRAGTSSAYYWGETFNAAYAWSSVSNVNAVAAKQPNAYSLYDMSGNVSEWCHDWSAAYGSAPQVDPTGPATGSAIGKVIRGGNWQNSNDQKMTASRASGFEFSTGLTQVGFRAVRRAEN